MRQCIRFAACLACRPACASVLSIQVLSIVFRDSSEAAIFVFLESEGRLGMAKQRRIKVSESGQVSVVTFVDSKIIDEAEIQEMGQELYDLVEREGRKKILLNFANVEFLSSAALGKLIGFDKRVKQHSAQLILSNIRPEIYEVFAITKLTKLFEIKDDEADALAVL
jgi:anti-sigma B factor antagonist